MTMAADFVGSLPMMDVNDRQLFALLPRFYRDLFSPVERSIGWLAIWNIHPFHRVEQRKKNATHNQSYTYTNKHTRPPEAIQIKSR